MIPGPVIDLAASLASGAKPSRRRDAEAVARPWVTSLRS